MSKNCGGYKSIPPAYVNQHWILTLIFLGHIVIKDSMLHLIMSADITKFYNIGVTWLWKGFRGTHIEHVIQTGSFAVSGSTVNISEMECNIIMTVCQHMQKHLGFTNVQFRKYPIICVRDIDHWILQWVSLADDCEIKSCTQKTGHS